MQLPHDISQTVRCALAEDLADGDLTASLIPFTSAATATVISRQAATICGRAWFDEVFLQLDKQIQIRWNVEDGDQVSPDQILCHLSGSSRVLLSGERTALNFLQTLSATATAAHHFQELIKGSGACILDTRKTLPCLRTAQKYAVRCGGAKNHRIGLFDGILLKENHIMAAGSIRQAVDWATKTYPEMAIEVEVENLDELRQAIDAGAHRVLLDNMGPDTLSQAVKIAAGKVELEASGGVDEKTIGAIANTGVNFISVGGITKNINAVDLSMRFSSNK